MKMEHIRVRHCVVVPAIFLVLSAFAAAKESERGKETYVCSEPHPESVCSSANTCGNSSSACTVEVKRTTSEAQVTPDIPMAKGNMPFCVKVGTTITWKGSSKNTGFVVDFGPDSPFEPAAPIIGGSDRPVSTVVKTAGCYKYSTGACISGSISGMCGSVETNLIITE